MANRVRRHRRSVPMTDSASSFFLVNANSDPVAVRIEGRASFQNCSCMKDFLEEILTAGKRHVVMDFLRCTSMDSTFLGVLAGAAIQLRRQKPPGSLVLCRLGPRNLELVRNLGLDRLLIVDTGEPEVRAEAGQPLSRDPLKSEVENARLVLEAHENLVAADSRNQAKFQDVLTFLKQRVRSSKDSPAGADGSS
jgi:anti-sigma B factor antagonist